MAMAILERLQQPDVAGLSPDRISRILNEPDPTLPKIKIDVATTDARFILYRRNAWGNIILAAEGRVWPAVVLAGQRNAVSASCIIFRDMLTLETSLNTSRNVVANAFSGLVGTMLANELINSTAEADLNALVERHLSYAEDAKEDCSPRRISILLGAKA